MRNDILERKNDILLWIEQELPKTEIAKRLCCKIGTLNTYLDKLGIEYKGQQAKKGQAKGGIRYYSLDDYLSRCTYIKSEVYKKYLIKFGVKKAECECCKNTTWNNQPIPLELHHVDGNHYNNALDNVQLLCPNCHAQTSTNSGKNTAKHRLKLKKELAEMTQST